MKISSNRNYCATKLSPVVQLPKKAKELSRVHYQNSSKSKAELDIKRNVTD